MEKMFERCTLANLDLANRFVFPPIKTGYATSYGTVTDGQMVFYRQIARNGPGLVILEPVSVWPEGRKPIRRITRLMPSVDADRCVACGTREEVCPAGAISVGDIARVDPTLGVGCGLCVEEYPQGALSLDTRGPVREKARERMDWNNTLLSV